MWPQPNITYQSTETPLQSLDRQARGIEQEAMRLLRKARALKANARRIRRLMLSV